MKRSVVAKGVSGLLSLSPKITENKKNKKIKKSLSKGEKKSESSGIFKTRYSDNSKGRIFYANENSDSNVVLIYIHGGAYCNDFTSFHWYFLRKIVKSTNVKLIAPAYRLVPYGTYKEAFDLIIPIYEECLKKNNKVVLMGDSSGGGLALSISLYLKDNNIKLPENIILLSPWVDVSMKNDKIKECEPVDPLLETNGLKVAANLWKGDLSEHDWRVSPIYGNLDGLHNITTFVGTRELFYPDILDLYEKLDKTKNDLIIGKDMNHAYPLMPIPDSKEAINKIIDIIRSMI